MKNKQKEFLNKLNNIKIGKKTIEQKETINNLEKFTILEKLLIYLMLIMIQNMVKLREKDLK